MAFSKQMLNEAQRQAVEADNGNLLILAGPGTGKTRVIIQKIQHAIETGIQPERILAVTFSKKAATEMQDRLTALNPTAASLIEISTLHSLCLNIVQPNAFRLGLGSELELMTESQSLILFHELAPLLPLQDLAQSSYVDGLLRDLLDLFQDCKDEGLWPEDLQNFISNLPEDSLDDQRIKREWQLVAEIYQAFQTHALDQGYLDFGDAILSALRLLEDHPMVKKTWQDRFDVILVDEFQDTNWTQIKFLRELAGPNTHVAVVGDDDQSIYKFRGASYSAFEFFEELFPNPQIIELNETYRLPAAVLDAASALIQANGEHRYRPNKKIVSKSSQTSTPVRAVKSGSFEDETKFVIGDIQEKLKAGASPSDFAVLVRAHGHADIFVREARKAQLPLQIQSGTKLFDEVIIKDVFAFFDLCLKPSDHLSFLRLLDSPFVGCSAEMIFDFCRVCDFKEDRYIEFVESKIKTKDSSEFQKIIDFYDVIKTLYAEGFRKSCSDLLLSLCEQTMAIQTLFRDDQSQLTVLAQFMQQLIEWEAIQKASTFQKLYPILRNFYINKVSLEEAEDSGSSNTPGIRVLTMHASKGLEFRYIYILSLVGRRVPSAFRSSPWQLPNEARKEEAPTKQSHLEEERRLVYVAMTRAEQELTLSCVEKKGTKPSVFLTGDIEGHLSQESPLRWVQYESHAPTEGLTKSLQVFERQEKFKTPKLPQSRKGPLRLSFTQLDKYERCPLSYWFSYEVKIPTKAHRSLAVGSAVHESLENFYSKYMRENELPTKEFLRADFRNVFEKERKKNTDLTDKDFEFATQKLDEYFDHQKTFTKPLYLEKAFQFEIDGHLVTGKIDRVDPGHHSNEVIIIDYKTGKSKSADNKADIKFADESLQFGIYALAAKKNFNWSVQEMQFYYVYHNTVLSTMRSPTQLAQTIERIQDLAGKIQKAEFNATPGFHCGFCEFKKICPSSSAQA